MNVFKDISTSNHEQIIFCNDPRSGLKAIIAIHNTQLGPSLGGCRMYPYASEQEALTDVLRLSQSMTYKSASAGLNLGGGKSVIIGDPRKLKSEHLFRVFGRFVNGLNGRYITAEDVGTDLQCMEWARIETKYVVGLPTYLGGFGDPSPVTAHGVFVGIKACLKKIFGNDDLSGKKVTVQGVGHVGYHLCKELHEHGVKLYISDVNKEALKKTASDFDAIVVKLDEIYSQEVDIFAPCAMGAVLNDKTIPKLKCPIVAGSANNQLLNEEKHGLVLKKRGILYAPDYVINAGGLINVAAEYFEVDHGYAMARTEEIYGRLTEIFNLADKENIPPEFAAKKFAEKRICDISQCKNVYTPRKWVLGV